MELQSGRFKVGKKSWLKTLIITVGTPLLYLLQSQIPGWHLDPYIKASLSGGLTYLAQNFVTDDVKQAQQTIDVAVAKALKKQNDAANIPLPIVKD